MDTQEADAHLGDQPLAEASQTRKRGGCALQRPASGLRRVHAVPQGPSLAESGHIITSTLKCWSSLGSRAGVGALEVEFWLSS